MWLVNHCRRILRNNYGRRFSEWSRLYKRSLDRRKKIFWRILEKCTRGRPRGRGADPRTLGATSKNSASLLSRTAYLLSKIGTSLSRHAGYGIYDSKRKSLDVANPPRSANGKSCCQNRRGYGFRRLDQ